MTRLHANEAPWRPAGRRHGRGPQSLSGTAAGGAGRAPGRSCTACRPTSLLVGRGSDEAIDLLSRIFLRAGDGRDPAMRAHLRHVPGGGAHPGRRRRRRCPGPRPRLGARSGPAARAPGGPTSSSCICARPTIRPATLSTLGASKAVCTRARRQGHRRDRRGLHRVVALARASPAGSGVSPTLAILRTLSKAHALAGARIGALLAASRADRARADASFRPTRSRQPTIEAALARARARRSSPRRARGSRRSSRSASICARGSRGTPRWSTKVWPSDANFLLIDSARSPTLPAREHGRAAPSCATCAQIPRCRARSGSRWARAPRTTHCYRVWRRHERRDESCSWTATAP